MSDMSSMTSILTILLDRDASSHHEPNGKGTAARDGSVPKSRSPFSSRLVARGVMDGIGGMLSMLLLSLMRMTPPFWMPAREDRSSRQRGESLHREDCDSSFRSE